EADNRRLTRADEEARARDLALLLASGRLVGDLLVDRPVLAIVGPGVDDEVANGVRTMIGATGADFRATLTLRDPMLFDGDLDEGLAEALEVETENPTVLSRAVQEEL